MCRFLGLGVPGLEYQNGTVINNVKKCDLNYCSQQKKNQNLKQNNLLPHFS